MIIQRSARWAFIFVLATLVGCGGQLDESNQHLSSMEKSTDRLAVSIEAYEKHVERLNTNMERIAVSMEKLETEGLSKFASIEKNLDQWVRLIVAVLESQLEGIRLDLDRIASSSEELKSLVEIIKPLAASGKDFAEILASVKKWMTAPLESETPEDSEEQTEEQTESSAPTAPPASPVISAPAGCEKAWPAIYDRAEFDGVDLASSDEVALRAVEQWIEELRKELQSPTVESEITLECLELWVKSRTESQGVSS